MDKDKGKGKGISRRTFVSGMGATAALFAAGGVLTGCSPKQSQEGSGAGGAADSSGKTWSFLKPPAPITDKQIADTKTCDVLVIGAGISGIPAAARAAELGANVICIEKQGMPVMTRPTGFSCFGSSKLKELGVMCTEEEKERIIKDVWAGSNGTSKQELLRVWADRSGEYADWLIPIVEAAGIPVTVGGFFGYYAHCKTLEEAQSKMRADPFQIKDSYWNFYPVQHQFGSSKIPGVAMWSLDSPEAMKKDADWLTPLVKYSIGKGVNYVFNTRAVQLVREDGWKDDPSKRVTAVIAQNSDGTYVKYKATKGIIMATGGFDFDDEMLEAYYPIGLRMSRTWQKWFTGDGHKMAIWVGAKMDNSFVSHAMGTCSTAKVMKSKDNMMPPENVAMVIPWVEWNMPSTAMAPCLWVNDNGERFINEETGYFQSMPGIDAQPEHMYWGVWDSQWKTKVIPHYMDRIVDGNDSDERMAANVKAGMAIKADTIDDLIKQMQVVDGEKFKQTLNNYNAIAKAGKDTELLKPAKFLSTVDTPPFYAAQMGGSWMTTVGGVVIDTKMRVLDEKQKVIPGLFAGGNPAGGFYGNIYAPQIPMSLSGHSMTFSWVAAESVVKG